MHSICISALIFIFLVPAVAFDGMANHSFEKRMHEIYKSSYSIEVPDQEWLNYVEKIEDDSYTVKAGDTLWGLSKVFFGDGFFWSKIWSYNSTITNPHMLSVGSKVQFFSGSIALPPSMDVDGTSSSQGMIKITRSSNDPTLYPGAPDIPESYQEVKPVLENIPPVFRERDPLAGSNKFDSQGMSFDIRPVVRVNPLFVVHSFLYDGSASNYPRTGEVFESEDHNLAMGTNQKFYFKSDKTYSAGDMVTVMGKDYDFNRHGVSGDVIQYMGRAEVTDVMSEGRYRAVIKNSINDVRIGAWVTEEMIPSFTDDREGRASDVQVEVVGGAIENNREMLADGGVLFLDGGSNAGLNVNDVLGIYKVRKYRYDNDKVEVSPTPIGHVKIFRSEPRMASAFVIDSIEAILPGDRTGSPESVTGTITKSESMDLNTLEQGLDFEDNSLDSGGGDSFDDMDDFGDEGSIDSLEESLEEELETL